MLSMRKMPVLNCSYMHLTEFFLRFNWSQHMKRKIIRLVMRIFPGFARIISCDQLIWFILFKFSFYDQYVWIRPGIYIDFSSQMIPRPSKTKGYSFKNQVYFLYTKKLVLLILEIPNSGITCTNFFPLILSTRNSKENQRFSSLKRD